MKHLKLYEGFEKSDYYQELNFEQNLKWTSIHKFLEPMPKEEITWLMDRFPSNLYTKGKELQGAVLPNLRLWTIIIPIG